LGKENEQAVKRKLTQLAFYKRRVEELEKALVDLCRTIDRIEVTEGVDDLGQLSVGHDLTAQLLTARNEALGALWKGRVVE
jgi:cytochrome P450